MNSSVPAAQLRSMLQRHVTTIVTHMKGKCWAWDAINEPFDDDGSLNHGLWYNALGPGYIAEVLTMVHAIDPDALLFINQVRRGCHAMPCRTVPCGVAPKPVASAHVRRPGGLVQDRNEELNPKSDGMYAFFQNVTAAGVPLHGLGMECHLDLVNLPNLTSVAANIARFGALPGVQVHITELDISLNNTLLQTAADMYAQATPPRPLLVHGAAPDVGCPPSTTQVGHAGGVLWELAQCVPRGQGMHLLR